MLSRYPVKWHKIIARFLNDTFIQAVGMDVNLMGILGICFDSRGTAIKRVIDLDFRWCIDVKGSLGGNCYS